MPKYSSFVIKQRKMDLLSDNVGLRKVELLKHYQHILLVSSFCYHRCDCVTRTTNWKNQLFPGRHKLQLLAYLHLVLAYMPIKPYNRDHWRNNFVFVLFSFQCMQADLCIKLAGLLVPIEYMHGFWTTLSIPCTCRHVKLLCRIHVFVALQWLENRIRTLLISWCQCSSSFLFTHVCSH